MRWMGILAAAALVTGSTAGQAQAQSGDPIAVFTKSDFERALKNINARFESQADSRSIDITFDGPILANGLLMACEDDDTETNCYGTSILATFGDPDGANRAAVLEAINTYNLNENFGRAYIDADGVISVRMYIIADGSITRENYETQIGLWAGSLTNFFGYLYSKGAASDGS